jgi:hypothetical protein
LARKADTFGNIGMKLTLSEWIPESPDFDLIQIYCHQKDYRLCWALNEHLGSSFQRVDDFPNGDEHYKLSTYSQFVWVDDINHREYFLISNQALPKPETVPSSGLFATETAMPLIPELPRVDYFLQLYGQFDMKELNELEEQLNAIAIINAAQLTDASALKSYLLLMH